MEMLGFCINHEFYYILTNLKQSPRFWVITNFLNGQNMFQRFTSHATKKKITLIYIHVA